jgi:hypothetical protein
MLFADRAECAGSLLERLEDNFYFILGFPARMPTILSTYLIHRGSLNPNIKNNKVKGTFWIRESAKVFESVATDIYQSKERSAGTRSSDLTVLSVITSEEDRGL